VTLRERIQQEIGKHGPIPFSRYMDLCLYEPELGYYARHAGQFGKAGDFYTSSDVHAVFGRLLARCGVRWARLGGSGFWSWDRDEGCSHMMYWTGLKRSFLNFSEPCTTHWPKILLHCGNGCRRR